jgi:purine-binding chemotaxis protein CheW
MTPQEILAHRAQRLSLASTVERDPVPTTELLAFRIAGNRYAIETRFSFSVAQHTTASVLPGTPAHIVGIIGVQGEIIPAIDLANIWKQAAAPVEGSPAVVIGIDRPEFAVLVDSLDELLLRPETEIAAAAAIDEHREFVVRVFDDVALIDGKALLEDGRFAVSASREERGT